MRMAVPHFVVATAIVIKDGKYLITRRSLAEEKFPGMWTVPGGNLDEEDYSMIKPNADGVWYNMMEHVVQREVKEEVNLTIKNIRYLLSITYKKSKGPALCLSYFADYASGEVQISDDLDYAWVTIDEAKNYALIAGIHEELLMVDDIVHHRPVRPWTQYEHIAKQLRPQ